MALAVKAQAMRRDQGETDLLWALVDGTECGLMWTRGDREAVDVGHEAPFELKNPT